MEIIALIMVRIRMSENKSELVNQTSQEEKKGNKKQGHEHIVNILFTYISN